MKKRNAETESLNNERIFMPVPPISAVQGTTLDDITALLKELITVVRLLQPPSSPIPTIPLTENDYQRAKRAALDAREKSLQRRQQRISIK